MHNCTPIKGECLNVCKDKVNAWFFDLWNDCYMHVLGVYTSVYLGNKSRYICVSLGE